MNHNYFNIAYDRKNFSLSVSATFGAESCLGIYGESGSGKSTLLRCLAGLEIGVRGDFSFNGESYLKDGVDIQTAENRPVILCFQESKLFPHLNVDKNLAFSEKRANHNHDKFPDKSVIVNALNLQHLLQKYPEALSGGEKKRVALAQALLGKPKLLLLDEPLAFLDSQTQRQFLLFLKALLNKKQISLIYVSHNMQELSYLCEEVIVLDKGKVVFSGDIENTLIQQDSPLVLQDKPFVIIRAECISYDEEYGLSQLKTDNGQLFYSLAKHSLGEVVQLKIEANNVSLAVNMQEDSKQGASLSVLNQLTGSIKDVVLENKQSLLLLVDCGGDKILSKISRLSYDRMKLSINCDVKVLVKAASIYEI